MMDFGLRFVLELAKNGQVYSRMDMLLRRASHES
jgi:hypothetical protein